MEIIIVVGIIFWILSSLFGGESDSNIEDDHGGCVDTPSNTHTKKVSHKAERDEDRYINIANLPDSITFDSELRYLSQLPKHRLYRLASIHGIKHSKSDSDDLIIQRLIKKRLPSKEAKSIDFMRNSDRKADPLANRVGELTSKLKRWRREKAKDQYPLRIGLNTWAEMRSSQKAYDQFASKIWKERGSNSRNSPSQAGATSMFHDARDRHGRAAMDTFLSDIHGQSRGTIAGLDMGTFRRRIRQAQTGDNRSVDELEFGYVYIKCALDYFNEWCIESLAGGDPHDVYYKMSGIVKPTMPRDFDNLFPLFPEAVGARKVALGTKTLDEVYRSLPPLH